MEKFSKDVGERVMQAVILAAGLGTRLCPYTYETPKPLMPVLGKPFLYYLLTYLRVQSITDVVLCCGYRTDQIYDSVKDGSDLGLKITYSLETGDLKGSYCTLKKAYKYLDDVFVVMNGDTYIEVDFTEADAVFMRIKTLGMSVIYGEPDKVGIPGNVQVKGSRITEYQKDKGLKYVDSGVLFLKKEALTLTADKEGSIEDKIFQPLIKGGQLGFYEGPRFWDIGTPERWAEFERYMGK
jgi:mannose-1-phosphate guanylyltransferase